MAATLPMGGTPLTLAWDNNNQPIQSPRYLKFQDATASPLVSPLAAVGAISAPGVFTPPAGALAMVVKGDAAFGYGASSVLDGSAGKGYKKALANVDIRIPCINGALIYIGALTGTVNLDYHFEMI